MNDTVKEAHEKAHHFFEKHGDEELRDYLLSMANQLEQLEILRHHFGYFVMHAQAVVPYDSQPRHFREALARARKILAEG